jgi:hypothetical protein
MSLTIGIRKLEPLLYLLRAPTASWQSPCTLMHHMVHTCICADHMTPLQATTVTIGTLAHATGLCPAAAKAAPCVLKPGLSQAWLVFTVNTRLLVALIRTGCR